MRDILIILSMCVASLAIGAAVYFNSSPVASEGTPLGVAPEAPLEETPVEAAGPVDVPFTVLAQGSVSGMEKPKNFAVYSAEGLADLYERADLADTPPEVDFGSSYVIAVFAGTQAMGGVAVAVNRITDQDGRRVLDIHTDRPGSGCATTDALTSPYQLIRVPASDMPLAHLDSVSDVPCGS